MSALLLTGFVLLDHRYKRRGKEPVVDLALYARPSYSFGSAMITVYFAGLTPLFFVFTLVGAYLLAGELAAAGWDAEAGFAAFDGRMRSFVEANQEIGRMHVQSLDAPEPDAEPAPEPDMEALTELVERAINGVELPGYAGVPDSRL